MKIRTKSNKIRKAFTSIVAAVLILTIAMVPAFAAGDGVTDSLSKFNDLIFTIVRLLGTTACIWGLVEFAMSLQSHDGSQKTRGATFFAAGLIVVFSKEILGFLGVSL